MTEGARARRRRRRPSSPALETQVAGLDEGEVNLDERYEEVAGRLAAAEETVARLQAEDREAERERSALAARREALELGLARRDGAGALLAAGDRLPGVLGSLAALLTVEPGAESAIAAALGAAADAVAVGSLLTVVDAVELLKTDDAGRAGFVIGGGPYAERAAPWPASCRRRPLGDRPCRRRRRAAPGARPAARPRRGRRRPRRGTALVGARAGVRAVTRDGDLFGAHWAAGGSHSTPSPLEIQAALDETGEALTAANHRCDRLAFALGNRGRRAGSGSTKVDAALGSLHESDARMAAVAERLGQLGSAARAAAGEAERLAAARRTAEEAGERDLAAVAALEQRLLAAKAGAGRARGAVHRRPRPGSLLVAVDARQVEIEARLAVRTGEERARTAGSRRGVGTRGR